MTRERTTPAGEGARDGGKEGAKERPSEGPSASESPPDPAATAGIGRGPGPDRYAYPSDLAAVVRERLSWRGEKLVASPLLETSRLEQVLSTLFQASLLHDEGRAVRFRALLCPPENFAPDSGPPEGLHAVVFAERRPLDAQEVRRLASAAPHQRALLGLCVDAGGRPAIWGIVHSGARWLRVKAGGREGAPPMPHALVVTAGGPGRIDVSLGDEALARLDGGRIGGTTLDVFASSWLRDQFASTRREILARHRLAHEASGAPATPFDESLITRVAQHVLKQVITVIRGSGHGGTLLLVPPESVGDVCCPNPLLHIKYRFAEGEARARFETLLQAILDSMHEVGGEARTGEPIGWVEYRASASPAIAALDEGLFELAHLVAGLAAVDGAVVLTKRLEMIGFGAEILGDLPDIVEVARASDVEGRHRHSESLQGVGTRHRSAYRLCAAMHDALAIVVSQDGGVRFACWRDGRVTSWHYLSGGLLA